MGNGKVIQMGIGKESISAEGMRKALESRMDPVTGKVVLVDLVETSVLLMYFVQKLGNANLDNILQKTDEAGATVDPHLALQALEALRARGLVSQGHARKSGVGTNVQTWKPKRVVWAAAPELAHILDLLPALVATDEGLELIAKLNQSEVDGDGQKKAKAGPVIDKYVSVRIDFVTLNEMLGSQVASPALDALYKQSPYKLAGDVGIHRFWRDATDGALLIGTDCVRGWLGTNFRQMPGKGFGDSASKYVGVGVVKIHPEKGKLVQAAFPILDAQNRKGLGIATYECVTAGQTFSITFRIPERGFLSTDDFVAFIGAFGPNPTRGLSPARGGRFGTVTVVGHEVIRTDTLEDFLKASLTSMSPEGRAYAEALLAKKKKKVS